MYNIYTHNRGSNLSDKSAKKYQYTGYSKKFQPGIKGNSWTCNGQHIRMKTPVRSLWFIND